MTDPATTDPTIIIAAVTAGASVISAVAATAAAVGIWRGIGAMVRANKDRAAILDRQYEADERRHAEAMRRHDEAMQAGNQRHAEVMQAGNQRHAEAMRALEILIERTAPPAR